LCKTAVDWVNKIITIMTKVIIIHLLFVAVAYGKVILWLWKSLENSGNFFILLYGHRELLFELVERHAKQPSVPVISA